MRRIRFYSAKVTSIQKSPQITHRTHGDSSQSPYPYHTHNHGNPHGNPHTHGSPVDTPYVISYLWSVRTESLYPAVFEILCFKRIEVTSLTFQGHVTSSVTQPFDSPYAISYWCSFGTKPLSLTVSEIINVKCNAMVDVTLIRPLNKGQGHSFWYQSISHNYTTSYICSQQ